ncbi:unnamed protein product [Adineta steineri]|uniref:Uncharacterized protein n=1 Tax=Adineta steineri TaxID=433720 RepID=A0A814HGC8_9BILA|nr:unnamed protein product [Adineta steineri]CAF1061826.1 unnamed protein product [Adineta steineri]
MCVWMAPKGLVVGVRVYYLFTPTFTPTIKVVDSIRRTGCKETDYNRLLSIGKIYHTLSLVTEESQSQDTVVIYVQQHKP